MSDAPPKINLLDLDKQGMQDLVVGMGAKPFHGRNLLKWIHKHGVRDFEQMTDLPKSLREQLQDQTAIDIPEIVFEQPSLDGTTKWILELADGQRIETVAIPDGDRNTICVSSQVGCALDCSFCSTAQQGFNRNLSTGEIIGQVWQATRELGQPPSNVVMLSLIHISEPTRPPSTSRMPSSA